MIIPINVEAKEPNAQCLTSSEIQKVSNDCSEGVTTTREVQFGDILVPILSKYFHIKDSKRNDFKSSLAKEHPLKMNSFRKDSDKYELQLDVRKFKPEELSVKISNDSINILGLHEEKSDKHSYRREEFMKRYSLPSEVKADDIKCEVTIDGHLLISAPKLQHKISSEVTVPIIIPADKKI